MFQGYLKRLYQRTMALAYSKAIDEAAGCLRSGGYCLDCGAQTGATYNGIRRRIPLEPTRYIGVDWSPECVVKAKERGICMAQGDLNSGLPFKKNSFQCILALSVIEHLVNGCRFIKECQRVLNPRGSLVVLTPNISTFFTILQLLAGKMPSTGPHPDSNLLFQNDSRITVTDIQNPDLEGRFSQHRHMVVFSYRILKKYLRLAGFSSVSGCGFGHYPFPSPVQSVLEKVDPYHCHQMVMIARK